MSRIFTDRRFFPIAILFAAWMHSSPAQAQALKVVGEPQKLSGHWQQKLTIKGKDGTPVFIECYLLQTQRGQRWTVVMKQPTGTLGTDFLLIVAASRSCITDGRTIAADGPALLFSHSAKVSFVSGGGDYVVAAAANGMYLNAYTMEFKLSHTLATRGLASPGVEIADWARPDWQPSAVSSVASSQAGNYRPGTVLRDCEATCPEMVVLPAGTFDMGSPGDEAGRNVDERPRHPVRIMHPFAVSRYEITQDEYEACVADRQACLKIPSTEGDGRRPVTTLTWFQAQAYASWLSRKTRQHYSLLSEAEWEYAARAGSATPWNTGSAILTEDANILNQFKQTVPVGSYPANAFGLYDLHGNAEEWVLDCYGPNYFGAPGNGAAVNAPACERRVLRGGAFADEPAGVRSSERRHAPPAEAGGAERGFRLGRSL